MSPLSAKDVNLLDLDFKINFKELGQSAMAIINGDKTSYEIKGDLMISDPGQKEKRIPFLKSGVVPLR
jgi:hypothetical protein